MTELELINLRPDSTVWTVGRILGDGSFRLPGTYIKRLIVHDRCPTDDPGKSVIIASPRPIGGPCRCYFADELYHTFADAREQVLGDLHRCMVNLDRIRDEVRRMTAPEPTS